MARKTFISYKYSEARDLRDKIIKKLGNDAQFYRGENGFSDDLTSYTANTIKERLKDMIYDTSVTIVILSPNMAQSRWMPWEIEYSLGEYSRVDRKSHTNGVVCVVQNEPKPIPGFFAYQQKGSPNWLKTSYFDGMVYRQKWNTAKLFSILRLNMSNKKDWISRPSPIDNRQRYNSLSNNYIDIVSEDTFLRAPDQYIENAFLKSQFVDEYDITKRV